MTPDVPGAPFASAQLQRRTAVADTRGNPGSGVRCPQRSAPLPLLASAAVPGAE